MILFQTGDKNGLFTIISIKGYIISIVGLQRDCLNNWCKFLCFLPCFYQLPNVTKQRKEQFRSVYLKMKQCILIEEKRPKLTDW